MHILLVEPDRILAKSYTSALKAAGHMVACVVSAQSAIQSADTETPDVVIASTDIARHNGIEFLYEFKSYTEWQHVPVILLVGQLNHDMAQSDILQEQLTVKKVLVKSQLTLQALQDTVAEVSQASA